MLFCGCFPLPDVWAQLKKHSASPHPPTDKPVIINQLLESRQLFALFANNNPSVIVPLAAQIGVGPIAAQILLKANLKTPQCQTRSTGTQMDMAMDQCRLDGSVVSLDSGIGLNAEVGLLDANTSDQLEDQWNLTLNLK